MTLLHPRRPRPPGVKPRPRPSRDLSIPVFPPVIVPTSSPAPTTLLPPPRPVPTSSPAPPTLLPPPRPAPMPSPAPTTLLPPPRPVPSPVPTTLLPPSASDSLVTAFSALKISNSNPVREGEWSCPWCGEIYFTDSVACGIFRCGHTNGQALPPHLSKEECDRLRSLPTTRGCCMPFRFDGKTAIKLLKPDGTPDYR